MLFWFEPKQSDYWLKKKCNCLIQNGIHNIHKEEDESRKKFRTDNRNYR